MKLYRAVHQFHSGTAPGDAITQEMFFLRKILRAMDFESEIFAEHVHPTLGNEIRRLLDYEGADDQLLLWHHSMGTDAFETVVGLPDDKAVVYHNVTPARFFDDPGAFYYAELGRAQLRLLARVAKAALADSNFNRREMLEAGFDSAEVLPPRLDFDAFVPGPTSPRRRTPDWVFVGRLVPNKCQHHLMAPFAKYLEQSEPSARLVLVGDLSHRKYVDLVTETAEKFDVREALILTGKLSEPELIETLQSSGAYVSMSEHEGFGVPLLEAMAARLPVFAYATSAVPETVGGAGCLYENKDSDQIASLVAGTLKDESRLHLILEAQSRRLQRLGAFDPTKALSRAIARAAGGRVPPEIQIQGPFETSYSLAITNRNLALALSKDEAVRVSLFATEGPGDYLPEEGDLEQHPDATELYRRSPEVLFPDVVIRQMWPPRLADSPGGVTLAYFAWEESRVPPFVVHDFNKYAQAVGVTSEFVRDALRKSGVNIPIEVVGNGVTRPDQSARTELDELQELRGLRFLHISSAFPRKGVDALLKAYFAAFDHDDDVSLILKTFPNPHNEVGRLLAELRSTHPKPPDVRWIDRDLPPREVEALYGLADWYVHPARGEGFGLPIAEAMLAEVPVIAVEYSGMADFVSASTATVIPHTIESACSHFDLPGSVWAEPDHDALVEALVRATRDRDTELTRSRIKMAKQRIESRYSWDVVAQRWRNLIARTREMSELPSVAFISTWNTRCGIAEYTHFLLDALPPQLPSEVYANVGAEVLDVKLEAGITRCWRDRWMPDLSDLNRELDQSVADVIHLQFNYGFFELRHLGDFIRRQRDHKGVVITFHRTATAVIDGQEVALADIAEALALADALIVHQQDDVDNLAQVGLTANVVLIPQGSSEPLDVAPELIRQSLGLQDRRILSTFGFLLPHKGMLRLLEAVDLLRHERPDTTLLALTSLHPDPTSKAYLAEVEREIDARDLRDQVLLITDYLPDETARTILRASDVIVLPYDPTPESSSAAARFVLSAGRPVVASDLPIFLDAHDSILRVPHGDTAALVQAIRSVLDDGELAASLAVRAQSRAAETRWGLISTQHLDIYRRAARSARRRRAFRSGSGRLVAARL